MFISLYHYGQSGNLGKSFSWNRMQKTNYIVINPSKNNTCIGVNRTFFTYSTKHLQIINSRDLGLYFTPVSNVKAAIFTFTSIHQKYFKEVNTRIYKQNLSVSDLQDDEAFYDTLAILLSMIELGSLLCQ